MNLSFKAIQLCSASIMFLFSIFLIFFFQSNTMDTIRPRKALLCTTKRKMALIMNENVTSWEDFYRVSLNKCGLRYFKARDVASCLDNLLQRISSRSWLHFAFIGDSRIRQQFYNFLKVIDLHVET